MSMVAGHAAASLTTLCGAL